MGADSPGLRDAEVGWVETSGLPGEALVAVANPEGSIGTGMYRAVRKAACATFLVQGGAATMSLEYETYDCSLADAIVSRWREADRLLLAVPELGPLGRLTYRRMVTRLAERVDCPIVLVRHRSGSCWSRF